MSIDIRGLKETQAKMEQVVRDLRGEPFLSGMRQATLLVQRDAKINAPVDTGRLRASITPEVRVQGRTVQGVVGSNVIYAPFVELGTRPHWPPPGALATWAARHGFSSEFLVRRAIGLRGTKAVKYLERAFVANKDRIVQLIGNAVARIVRS
jgi:HK97 gp10 family phage protein